MNNSINTTSSSHDNDKQAQHHLFAELTENASIGKSNEAKLSALAMVANLIDEETSVYKEKTIVHPGLMTVLLQNAKLGETFDIKEQALAVLTFLLTWLAATGGPQIIVEHKMDKFDRLKLLHFWALVRNIWVFHSAREIKRISKNSALKKLPKDLTSTAFSLFTSSLMLCAQPHREYRNRAGNNKDVNISQKANQTWKRGIRKGDKETQVTANGIEQPYNHWHQ